MQQAGERWKIDTKFQPESLKRNYRLGDDSMDGHLNLSSNKLLGFSPPANYTDQATAACRRS
jgi:hypothetical protein